MKKIIVIIFLSVSFINGYSQSSKHYHIDSINYDDEYSKIYNQVSIDIVYDKSDSLFIIMDSQRPSQTYYISQINKDYTINGIHSIRYILSNGMSIVISDDDKAIFSINSGVISRLYIHNNKL